MSAIAVTIAQQEGSYQLLRDGKPYIVKGAGIGTVDVAAFAAHGGNSFRTWSTNNAQQVLATALEYGLTVSMCIWIGVERHGFDYNDEEAVVRQFEYARQEVLKYRDHPALLTWIIGNELNQDYSNPKVYDAVNAISRMIHDVDSYHPTTTAITGFSKEVIDTVVSRAPDLDFLSTQLYGGLVELPRAISESGFDKPVFVTEWGAVGHWEVDRTRWGAPIEATSSEKANNYLTGYQQVIAPLSNQVIGNYVFLWGQKQERTPTWYGLFTEAGEETEAVDVMHYIWNGQWPKNRTPQIVSMLIDGKAASDNVTLTIGNSYESAVEVMDLDDDPIRYQWEIKPESRAQSVGGDTETIIDSLTGLIEDPTAPGIRFAAPSTPGAYRLFVYAYDGQGHAAHANIPFYVDG